MSTPQASQKTLFTLFASIQEHGGAFRAVADVNTSIKAAESAVILKHDIHDLSLDQLVRLAEKEQECGIRGTWLFMPSGHPRTCQAYDFKAQGKAMRAIEACGHEIGLHIDPFYQLDAHPEYSLKATIERVLGEFRDEGIKITTGNLHGNSKFKGPDNDGFGTMFEFFEEVARQPDFPSLSNVPKESAEIIRRERISLKSLGIEQWCDMPLWTATHGMVRTGFVTDNNFGRTGKVEVLFAREDDNAWCLLKQQPPGSRTRGPVERRISTGNAEAVDWADCVSFNEANAHSIGKVAGHGPTLILIHPEFYVGGDTA